MGRHTKVLITLLFLYWQLPVTKVIAQHTSMEHHQRRETSSKNIYLQMMDGMMAEMANIPITNSPEEEFMRQMTPHHHGAISMAEYEIIHGKDVKMIQLAKSILTEQKSQVIQMNRWLTQNPDIFLSDSTDYRKAMNKTMDIMMESIPSPEAPDTLDRAFALVMIPHHQAAINMAKVVIRYSTDQLILGFARHLISEEQIEIDLMKDFISK
ncbi:DUF305 domain-containing protein [Algoriphagus sp. Y33]|uniref:DUF305 domain-containing protein n=1 Tax=Algoriphagus sp. Y33 TaxID=2772483 RepID=UPI0017873C02|nr:DUF305 domain-containing protein [Algoriphagus sp. Y33]